MPSYYVLVSQMGRKGRKSNVLIYELCGKLWSVSKKYADAEAQRYANTVKLNGGLPLAWLLEDFYIVVAVTEHEARRLKGFNKYRKNIVTPEPLGSLTIWPDQPDWNKFA